MNQKRARGGFTLIELLVVIAIIGVLAAVVLVSLSSARERGRDAKRLADVDAVRLALEIYADQNLGVYPDDIGGSPGLGPDNASWVTITGVLVTEGLLSATPIDPLGGRVYVAQLNAESDATTYILGFDLETEQGACLSDYDGADLEDPDLAPFAMCAEDDPGVCAGEEPDALDLADYCVCQGSACS